MKGGIKRFALIREQVEGFWKSLSNVYSGFEQLFYGGSKLLEVKSLSQADIWNLQIEFSDSLKLM